MVFGWRNYCYLRDAVSAVISTATSLGGYYYYYYYYKSKDFSDASQKVAGALYKVTVCAVQVELTVKKSAKAVSHWNDS